MPTGAKRRGPRRATRSAPRKPLSHSLPDPLTSFVGREREIDEIKGLFAGTRLLTLTGAAGTGKTRLALRVASDVEEQFPEGVWFVDLAPLTDPALVPQTVATAVGVRESGRSLLPVLADYFERKCVLVVLDNCEHVLLACVQIAGTLLRGCPNLHMLATSREGLGITGELIYAVPPLTLPDLQRLPAIHGLKQYEAIRLFVDRALFSKPGFRLTRENATTVVEVCHRLDGLPLAIELAAARIRALSIHEIAARLGDRFRLLTGGDRAALAHRQTLRATIDWSYALLTEPERTLLRRLSVFVGCFTLEAASAVCGQSEADPHDVFDLLVRLVEKSLVVPEEQRGRMRYRLLETVRDYGREKVEEAGEAARLRRRHCDWYLDVAERGSLNLRGPGQQSWLAGLEAEHDNFRAALEWCQHERDGAEPEMRLIQALWWFWYIRGHWNDARCWIDRALERSADVSPPLLVPVLAAAAFFAWRQNDYDGATMLAERGLSLCREPEDRDSMIWPLVALGITALRQADYAKAETLLAKAVALSRASSDRWFLNMTLAQQGVLALHLRDFTRAIALHAEALGLARELEDNQAIAYQLRNLGLDMLRWDKPRQAVRHYLEGLEISRELEDAWITAECLEGLAGVANAVGQYGTAAKLFGIVEALHKTIGSPRSAANQVDFDERAAVTRARLGEAKFATAWAEGDGMTRAEATEYALAAMTDAPEQDAGEAPRAPRGPGGALGPREREVAVLVATGLSNREIAARLTISKRTVETHVQHILNKLGVNSRAQIAVWALQHRVLTDFGDLPRE